MDVQIWMKAYSSLVKNSLELDNRLLGQVVDVLAAGNSHAVKSMSDYYCMSENIKEDADGFSCRDLKRRRARFFENSGMLAK